MAPLPTIFLSHGAPDLPVRQGAAADFMRSFQAVVTTALHEPLPKPEAILVISAHWNTRQPTVSLASQPRTIHDFSGFPEALYQLNYPAPGAPKLAERAVALLHQAGFCSENHPSRGLDHGAWTPLLLAYPEADIPVTQLSLQYDQGPLYHWQLGQALQPLRQEGVLIIGSGSATHNFSAFDFDYQAASPFWVQQFDHWLADMIEQGDWQALLNYRQIAPFARENHPTEEHLLPLFVALGAAGEAKGIQLHQSYVYGAFSMAAYAFR